MPEYLAPGVYIEEVSFRAKTIEGVSTSTAGFVGPTRFGPLAGDPEMVTSVGEFERIFGSLDQLEFDDNGTPRLTHNFMAHGVRSFFEEGGKRLYVVRVFRQLDAPASGNLNADGYATLPLEGLHVSPPSDTTLTFRARYPGAAGNVQVTFTARVGQNVLAGVAPDPAAPTANLQPTLRGLNSYDLVWIYRKSQEPVRKTAAGGVYWTERTFDNAARKYVWQFKGDQGAPDVPLEALTPGSDEVRLVTLTVEVSHRGRIPRAGARTQIWQDLAFHPEHERWVGRIFAPALKTRREQLSVPIALWVGDTPDFTDRDIDPGQLGLDGIDVARTLLDQPRTATEERVLRHLFYPPPATGGSVPTIFDSLGRVDLGDAARQFTLTLSGGNDGVRPTAKDYEGEDDSDDVSLRSGLRAFESVADISIVAAPGSSFGANNGYAPQAAQITRLLISHCERMSYRIAVLDAPDGQALSEVRRYRGQVDSKHAALYYPWIRILDPVTEEEIYLPPSGFVSGIYARNDIDHGVHKAPANEVVREAIGLETLLNKAQQDVLNPEGVNCFRFFEGRGYRLWGARTISSDPEWKYVNLRRYFAYLERSIERGTQWVVFENNSEVLWANVTRTVEDFLFNEWKSSHLMGEKPQEAYFVRCDRSTMTQNDIDNGRLVCLVGVAAVRPAEFVIFRIGQWTADRRA